MEPFPKVLLRPIEAAEAVGISRARLYKAISSGEIETVVIGRSRDCDIRLADPNVSRRHAEVRQEGTAYWILDLGSTNGLTVNGRRQQRARLENDDRITVGSTELVFRRS